MWKIRNCIASINNIYFLFVYSNIGTWQSKLELLVIDYLQKKKLMITN